MSSSLVDAILLIALVLTTLRVGAMYRELRRLRLHHDEYRRVFADTANALSGIQGAVRELNGEGRELLAALGERIDEARRLAAALERSAGVEGGPPSHLAFEPFALAARRRM
jgi:hypothetical protein